MRNKMIMILILSIALFVSLTVGTLSDYTSSLDFGVSISPASGKIK